ncbi:unnamed protein product [Camellia sinensis]
MAKKVILAMIIALSLIVMTMARGGPSHFIPAIAVDAHEEEALPIPTNTIDATAEKNEDISLQEKMPTVAMVAYPFFKARPTSDCCSKHFS